MPSCSVIIVTYYTGPILFACLKSVLKQTGLHEIILVDNGNPPDVFARLQQMALLDPRLKIVTGHGNIGFASACNRGAKEAKGEFLLFLNPDCLLPPDALVQTIAPMENLLKLIPGPILAGCWLLNPDGTEQRGGRRQLLTPKTALIEALGLHRWLKTKRLNEHETLMPNDTHEVAAVSGAFMCIRKEDFSKLYGFDEAFFLHVEDLDLCMRVQRAGGKVICVPQVKVIHLLSTSGETTSRFVEWQKAKGFIRYFNKHFRGRQWLVIIWLLDLAILMRFALKTGLGILRDNIKYRLAIGQKPAVKRMMVLASGLAELPETKELHGTTVLVTGATSQVGLCVLRRLIAAGASVLAISRENAIPFPHEQLRWIKGDLTDRNLHLEGYLIDAVVHCAPLWHLPPTIELLADAEIKRVVAFGSTSIFGKALSKNDYEKNIVESLTRAEADTAEHCKAKNMEWTILRPTLIYGVGLDVNVTSLAKTIRRFDCFPVYPPAFGHRHPVHADDLALAVMQSLRNPASYGKSYNVSGGEIVTYRQMLERIFTLYRKNIRIIETTFLPFILDTAGKLLRIKHLNGEIARRMNDDLVFFHDEATKDFGFSPRAFLSGGIRDIEGF